MIYSYLYPFLPFILLNSIQALSTTRPICPSNQTKIALIYSVAPLEIEILNTSSTPKSINDLKGFAADVFKKFLDFCPLDYELIELPVNHSLDTQSIQLLFPHHGNIISMNMRIPRDFSASQFSQPVLVSPSALVFLKHDLEDTQLSMNFLFKYGFVSLLMSVYGMLVLMTIWKIEGHTRDIKEALWNFLLCPFGLFNESLMTFSVSSRIFGLTWVIAWFLGTGFFWAELSSNMTVSKLTDEINSFEEVLSSKRLFFWLEDVKLRSFKTVDELR